MHRYRSAFAASLFLVLSISCLHAQTRDTAIAHTYRDPNEIVIKAIRSDIRRASVPFGVSTIELPDAGSDRSIAPMLHALPGLQVSDRFNYAVGERITNRGFGARTQFGVRGIRVVQDGIPLTFADGQSALESIDPQELASIQLLNGPASGIYGNAAGGALVVNSFFSSPYLLAASGRAVASAANGSNGLLQYNASIDRLVGESVLLGGSYNRLRYGGFRDHSSASVIRSGFRAATDFNKFNADALGTRDLLTVNGRYTEFHAQNPGALTRAEFDRDITLAASSALAADARKDGHQTQIGASWQHGSDSSRVTLSGYAIGRGFTNPIVGKITDLARLAGGGEIVYSNTMTSSLGLQWNAGVSLDLMNDDRRSFKNDSGRKGAITLDQNERVTASALFAQVLIAPLRDVTAMAAVRYDRTQFGVTDHVITSTDPDDTGDRTMEAVSPALGMIWRVAKDWQLFGNVSTSFETPTTTELSNQPSGAGGFNADLDPQHAIEFETGVRGRVVWWMNFDLTGYLTNIRGELVPFELPDAPGRAFYRNAGSSRHQGLEASLLALPFDSLDIRAAFTYIDATYADYTVSNTNFSGNQVPGVAPTVVDLAATYHLPWGIRITGELYSVGRTMTNDANTVSADPYTIYNVTLGTDGIYISAIESSLSILAGVENATDSKYISSVVVNAAANRYFEPGSGRSFWVSASLRLFAPHREAD